MKQEQKIKRCDICGSFISPKSENPFCNKHDPIKISLGEGMTAEEVKKIKENWKPGTVILRPATKKETRAVNEFRKKAGKHNERVIVDIDKNKHVDIEDESGGDFKHTFRIPDPEAMDFKDQFAYRNVTADNLKSILGKIKMDFGGSIEYDVYMKRSGS